MATITINFGDMPKEDFQLTSDGARFKSLARSMSQIGLMITNAYGDPFYDDFVEGVLRTARLKGDRQISEDAERLLRISWQTELGARMGDALDEAMFMKVMAISLPVNSYYAMFNGWRALRLITGAVIKTHSAFHRDFAATASKFPLPWNVTMNGDPENMKPSLFVPEITDDVGIDPLRGGYDPPAYLAAALRTTRRRQLSDKREEWLASGTTKSGTPRKRMPDEARVQLLERLRGTTLIDLMYELRRRANYNTGDEFMTDVGADVVRDYHDGMLVLLDCGLCLVETLIAGSVGAEAYRQLVDEWLANVEHIGPWAVSTIEGRSTAIIDALG